MDWFWAHDIQPHQVTGLAGPGMRLVRLSRYGDRYAALFHTGAPTTHLLDAAELPTNAVSVTAGLSFVLDPAVRSTVYAGLDADALRSAPRGIADLATYTVDGRRRFALVVDGRLPGRLLFPGVTGRQLRAELRRHRATLLLLRAHGDGLFTAVAAPGDGGTASGDGVATPADGMAAPGDGGPGGTPT